jgi:putative modified peptide
MSYQIPELIVDKLLSLLATDDSFRSKFASDAREALAAIGFEPAGDSSLPHGIWNCLQVDALASKDSIRDSLGALRQQLCASKASYQPILLGCVPEARKAA